MKKITKISNIEKIEKYIFDNYCFKFNILEGYLYFKKKDDKEFIIYNKHYRSNLYVELKEKNFKFTVGEFNAILNTNQNIEHFNPLNDYFISNNKLNNKYDKDQDYLKELFNKLKLEKENENDLEYFKKWFVGAVATVFEEKNCNHICLILKGDQGIYKSTFLKKIVPETLKKYFIDNKLDKGKDDEIAIVTNFIINFDELQTFNKVKKNKLKSYLTQKDFNIRKPYDKTAMNYKRYSSYCGSGNEDQFLTDLTGNRRFLIYEVENIDINFDNDFINNVWKQAYILYKKDYEYWFNQK